MTAPLLTVSNLSSAFGLGERQVLAVDREYVDVALTPPPVALDEPVDDAVLGFQCRDVDELRIAAVFVGRGNLRLRHDVVPQALRTMSR